MSFQGNAEILVHLQTCHQWFLTSPKCRIQPNVTSRVTKATNHTEYSTITLHQKSMWMQWGCENSAVSWTHRFLDSVRHHQLNSLGEMLKRVVFLEVMCFLQAWGGGSSFSALISENSEVWVCVPSEHTVTHTLAPVRVIAGNLGCVIQKHAEGYNVTPLTPKTWPTSKFAPTNLLYYEGKCDRKHLYMSV